MFCGPNPDDAEVAAAKREVYAAAFAAGNESRDTDPEPSLIARPIPPEHRLQVTRDHIARGTAHGIVLHRGEIVDGRGHDVKELLKLDKTLFATPTTKEHA